MLEKRINDQGRLWRHVMKGLTVLQYLVYEGSGIVLKWLKSHIYLIKSLCEFRYADSRNVDQGGPIRQKARTLSELIQDPSKLEREKENYIRIRQQMGKPGIVDLHSGSSASPSARKPHSIVTSRMTLDLETLTPPSPTINRPPNPSGPKQGGPQSYRPSLEGRYSLSLPLYSIEEEFDVISNSGILARITSKSEQREDLADSLATEKEL